MSLRLYTHQACLAHDTGPGHPERPERLRVVVDALKAALPGAEWCEAPAVDPADLMRVHADALLDDLWARRPEGVEFIDADTAFSPGSLLAARHAAGAGIAALEWVLGGPERRAFCAVRPPGHHAEPRRAMGFCLFNNIAVMAACALRIGIDRVVIADFDVHHGNGTQACFEREPRVLFASSHEAPLYPHTGGFDETGVGNIFNRPVLGDTSPATFRSTWTQELLPAIDAFAPQLLLVSAGFDAHRADPLASLNLEADDYAWLTTELRRIADRHAGGRMVAMLEGGYDLDALAACAVAHVRALDG